MIVKPIRPIQKIDLTDEPLESNSFTPSSGFVRVAADGDAEFSLDGETYTTIKKNSPQNIQFSKSSTGILSIERGETTAVFFEKGHQFIVGDFVSITGSPNTAWASAIDHIEVIEVFESSLILDYDSTLLEDFDSYGTLKKSYKITTKSSSSGIIFDYFVDQDNGDDSNDGRSLETAWATLGRVHTFARATSPITNTLTLSGSGIGERTATLSGTGTWSSDYIGWNINLRSGSNAGAATILSVDGNVATVMITVVAPGTVFASADWSLTEQLDGSTDRVWVAAATWSGPAVSGGINFDNDTMCPRWSPATSTRLEVHFEAGTVMDDEQEDPARSCFGVAGGSNFTFAIYGDPDTPIQILRYGGDKEGGVVGGSGQAFAGNGAARIEGYNFFVSVCGDGISLHDSSVGHFENGHVEKHQKLGIANINQSYASFINVDILGRVGYPAINNSVPTEHSHRNSFINCRVLADDGVGDTQTVVVEGLGGGTWIGGQMGSPTRVVELRNTKSEIDTYQDCYMNCYSIQAVYASFTRCYGRMTYRQRDDYLGHTFRNCVWVGASTNLTGTTRGFFFRNFDAGADAQRSILDCVISGYLGQSAAGANFNSTDAGYWISSNSELRFCCFHGNTLNINANLDAANTSDGGTKIAANQSVDPGLANPTAIAAGSVNQADYCVTNQLLIGGGHDDGNIGFTLEDLSQQEDFFSNSPSVLGASMISLYEVSLSG